VVEDVADSAKRNAKVIGFKAAVLVGILAATGVEAALVGVGLIAARFGS
jgi:hypothetical protein